MAEIRIIAAQLLKNPIGQRKADGIFFGLKASQGMGIGSDKGGKNIFPSIVVVRLAMGGTVFGHATFEDHIQ